MKNLLLILLLQDLKQEQIKEQITDKLSNAPDGQYGIGILIGSLLPFIVLVLLAYLLYSYMKRKGENDSTMFD